jgi:hypothetical protein
MTAPLRLALVGLTGTGKSTLVAALRTRLASQGERVAVLKLAAPLYRLQGAVYAEAGVSLSDGRQDQELLADLAAHLRRIRPPALVEAFLTELAEHSEDAVVLNDDLRDPGDADRLRQAGFRLVRLTCPEPVRRERLEQRGDTTILDEPARLGPAMDRIRVDLTIETTAPAAELASHILAELPRGRHARQ